MATQRKVFAQYFSPGLLFSETSLRPLEGDTYEEAVRAAASVEERHGAKPFGFDLVTHIVADPVDDGEGGTLNVVSKEVERRGRFYLGGDIYLYDRVVAEEGADSIWASNMRCNRDPVSIVIVNGYKSTQIFRESNVVVDERGVVVRRGDEPELVRYRAAKIAEWDAER